MRSKSGLFGFIAYLFAVGLCDQVSPWLAWAAAILIPVFLFLASLADSRELSKRRDYIPPRRTTLQNHGGPRFASQQQKRYVFDRDHGVCRHCGVRCVRTGRKVSNQANFDHIKPYSWGGTTTVDNLQLLCRHCNLQKSNKFVG